jgi:undecaprenyl-diphosphatase
MPQAVFFAQTRMQYYIQILLLAVVQGAAELLPVSSSAHVILAQKLLGLDPSDPKQTFLLIMLHTGTMFAVIVYFWPRWKPLLVRSKHTPGEPPSTFWQENRFLWLALFATLVTGLGVGVILVVEKVTHRELEELFKRLDLIGLALLTVGVFILIAGFLEGRIKERGLTQNTALLIGLVQGLCLPFRGFSRSGATISTALLCGVPRRLAEDFSFALAVLVTPAAIGRYVFRLLKDKSFQSWDEVATLLAPGIVGMLFSFAAGYVALKLLSAALEHGRWRYFGFYCLAASAVLFGFAWYGW